MSEYVLTEYGGDWQWISKAIGESLGQAHAAEAHGMLCALLCSGQALDPGDWVMRVINSVDAPTETALLLDLLAISFRQLNSEDCTLQLLLPDDEEPLPYRARALGRWCQGFLYGLGEGGADLDRVQRGGGNGILQDLSEITRATFDPSQDEQEGEQSYMEIFEYVRVSVLLIHELLRSNPDDWRGAYESE